VRVLLHDIAIYLSDLLIGWKKHCCFKSLSDLFTIANDRQKGSVVAAGLHRKQLPGEPRGLVPLPRSDGAGW
jgi:hypothetical protein